MTKNLEPVTLSSSAIHQVQYREKQKELDVYFRSGEIVTYKKVPKDVYLELIKSNSVGNYFNLHIRDNYASYS